MDARRTELLKASPRMFESDLLDKLSRVHPAVPVVIFLPEIVVLLVLAIDAGGTSPLGLIGLFVAGYWAVLGTPLWYGFGAGFIAGYLIYDMTHYHLPHHKPKTRIGKRLRELHMRHHFQDDTVGFGISAPYWDTAFRTYSPKAKKPDSVEARLAAP